MTTYAASETPASAPAGCGEAAGGSSDGDGGAGLPPHRLLAFARAVDGAFSRLGEEPAWSMTAAEQAEALLLLE
jgi:hypothetical protein